MLSIIIAVFLVVPASCDNQTYYEKQTTTTPASNPEATEKNYDWEDWTPMPMPQPTDASGNEVEDDPYDDIDPARLFNIGNGLTFMKSIFESTVLRFKAIWKDKSEVDIYA